MSREENKAREATREPCHGGRSLFVARQRGSLALSFLSLSSPFGCCDRSDDHGDYDHGGGGITGVVVVAVAAFESYDRAWSVI